MTTLFDPTVQALPKLHKGGYYLTQPRKPWLVKGIVREGSLVFINGKQGTGKSLIGLELDSCVAEGRDFFGNAVSQGEAIYVANERGESQRERLEALRDAKKVNPDSIHFFHDYQFKFNVPSDERLFIEAVEAAGVKPKVILIDTLRASLEGDENSSAVAQAYVDALHRIRRHFDCTIVVLHHVNAWGQSRGSSAFIGAADTELYVTQAKKTGKVSLTVRKQNNGRQWTKYVLCPEVLDFGNDYSSIVLRLEGEEAVDEAPDFDDEDAAKDNNIIMIVDSIGERISLYRLHTALAEREGQARNKTTLKKDCERLGKAGQIKFEQIDKKFFVEPVGFDETD